MCRLFRLGIKLGIVAAICFGVYQVADAVKPGCFEPAAKRIQSKFQKHFSPEYELERIRGQIAKLTPDMHRNIDKIAEETVAVASLNRKIEVVQGELTNRKSEILAMTEAVENGTVRTNISGRQGTPNLKDKLTRDLRSYKNCEKDLECKQKLLAAKKESLDAARSQLQQITVQKQELEVLAAQFEAELANLREAQARTKFAIDDSRLAKIKEAFETLRQRIDVERTKAEMHGTFLNNGAVTTEKKEEQPGKDIVSEVREYFGESRKSDGAQ